MPSQLLTQHKIKVTVTNNGKPIPVLDWDKMSGGDVTHSITRVRPAAGAKKEVLTGDSEFDNITVEAFVDPVAHNGFLKDLKNLEKFEGTTIAFYAIGNDGVKIGDAIQYTGCSVAKVTLPSADANGEDAAKLVIEWAVGD